MRTPILILALVAVGCTEVETIGVVGDAGAAGDLGVVRDILPEATGYFRLDGWWTGSKWRPEKNIVQDQDTCYFHGVWGSGPSDVWVFGGGGYCGPEYNFHWDGAAWDTQPGTLFSSMWGTGPSDVWAVRGDAIFHWNGSAWTAVKTGVQPGPLWGSGPSDVWAGPNLHWNGEEWRSVSSPDIWEPIAIWGSGPADVWMGATGSGAGILHWDGMAWSLVSTKGTGGWYMNYCGWHGLWGDSASSVWVVGWCAPGVQHWDGTAWTDSPNPPGGGLTGVWGSSASDVWAVGLTGTIIHWDGTSWSLSPIGTEASLLAIWGSDSTNIWAVGEQGTILRYSP